MKTKALFLLGYFIICLSSFGQQVSEIEAISVAKSEILYTKGINTEATNVYSFDSNGFKLIYEVILGNGYSVLVSGNKQCVPAIGRYPTCGVGSVFNQTDIPCGLSYFLQSYKEQIMYCFEHPSLTSEHRIEWEKMVNGENIYECNRSGTVDSLLLTKWGQGAALNSGNTPAAYNYFTPPEDGCEHSLTGCVAVAMAQVMNYWKWPVLIADNWQFDWCNMPKVKLDSNFSDIERNAVARLMERCGAKVNMHYGCDNSFSFVVNAKSALDKMGYDEESDHQLYAFHSGSWETHLKENIDNGWPVIYGAGSYIHNGHLFPSHCFVCDGYSNDGKFHFNWGWRGSHNGFFYVTQLDPGNHNYSNYFSALFDLHPAGETISFCDITMRLDAFYSMYQLSNPDSIVALHDITPTTFNQLVSAPASSPTSYRTIPTGASAEYVAHEEIVLQPGFTAEYGSDFTARIESCAACEGRMVQMEHVPHPDSSNETDINAQQTVFLSGDSVFALSESPFSLFPNPNNGLLTVNSPEEVVKISIFNQMGKSVHRWFIASRSEKSMTLNVENLPSGTYILHITTKNGKTHAGRFVRQ